VNTNIFWGFLIKAAIPWDCIAKEISNKKSIFFMCDCDYGKVMFPARNDIDKLTIFKRF
jgi:hypothetical protein